MPISFSGRACPVQSQKSSRSSSEQQHDLTEHSPTARRELQLLEDHRPWEMLDNMVLAIIDQTYTALLRMHGRAPPDTPAEDAGAGSRVVASQPADPSDPDSPLLCVEASARHCCIHVPHHSRGAGGGEFAACSLFPTFPNTKAAGWPPRHRLTRTRIHATLGTLYMARVDGGARGDYWSCADNDVARPDVVRTGLRGVVDAIRSRLDAAVRVEATMVEMMRAHRIRGPKVVGIFRVWTALGQMKREVSLDVIARRGRFQKRRRVELMMTARPPAVAAPEVGVEEGEAEALAKSFNALQVDEDEAEVLTKRLKAMQG